VAPYALVGDGALNAEASGIASRPPVRPARLRGPAFGLVMVGDLFYERPLAERALAFITAAGSRRRVLVGDPQRSYFPKDRFQRIAKYSVP
jgi:predicted nicotinamide N-methyase